MSDAGIIPGLCSISFRVNTADEIIAACSGLQVPAIEWGGDVHVPHGDCRSAEKIRKKCEKKGITCPSYGSYYRAGTSEREGLRWEAVLDSAEMLGCRTIRIWGGDRSPAEADASYYTSVAEDIRRTADLAEKRGMTLSLEYHEKTLTESPDSLRALDKRISHPNVRYYWQPPHGYSDQQCIESLKDLGNKLTNLHVFHWQRETPSPESEFDRRPLREGSDRWTAFFRTVSDMPRLETDEMKRTSGGISDRFAFLEFFRGDSFLQFEEDWKTLLDLLHP